VNRTSVAVIYHFFPHYRKGIIEELSRDPHVDVTFVGAKKGIEGIKEYSFSDKSNFLDVATYYIGNIVFQPYVILICLFGRFDSYVFLANPYFITTWIGAAICRVRRRRVVFWGHGFKSDVLGLSNRVRRCFFSLANSFYTYGWRAKQIAVLFGFDPSTVHVGFNSLDYVKQIEVRNVVSKNNVQPVSTEEANVLKVLCISRLTDICRYDLLFTAAHLAYEKYGLVLDIVLIGDGPVRGELEKQADDLQLNVKFVGAIYDEVEIANYLFNADVTVSPGKVGLTAMHSLMYGTPVISNDDFVSQMPEVEAVVDGKTGLLFKRDDFADLAEKLKEFSSVFVDRELTRLRCYQMIDAIYNPMNQTKVLVDAVRGRCADKGDDAFVIFDSENTK
jgi:glycosyltransferase involved in cell wall biosynthesis